MKFFARVLPLVAVAGAAVLSGCATPEYHYSQLLGKRYFRPRSTTYAVSIVSIDGRDTTIRPALVDPGVREVKVQGPPGGARNIGETRSISLNVAPCTRYYLVAVKQNRLDSDFNVRVDFEEPVPGCTAPRSS